ncbi:hypothetical protein TGRH88_032500 [Toxoplasma gondii]|uniref:Uncharacterized protein n=1 Tax=Toxoplasma gondii TaxID=5811 RepID=A0A7J6K9B4_TOXGO|nr:hypothetical protein TGRH88_032500 [Toxoplasma gondii]
MTSDPLNSNGSRCVRACLIVGICGSVECQGLRTVCSASKCVPTCHVVAWNRHFAFRCVGAGGRDTTGGMHCLLTTDPGKECLCGSRWCLVVAAAEPSPLFVLSGVVSVCTVRLRRAWEADCARSGAPDVPRSARRAVCISRLQGRHREKEASIQTLAVLSPANDSRRELSHSCRRCCDVHHQHEEWWRRRLWMLAFHSALVNSDRWQHM